VHVVLFARAMCRICFGCHGFYCFDCPFLLSSASTFIVRSRNVVHPARHCFAGDIIRVFGALEYYWRWFAFVRHVLPFKNLHVDRTVLVVLLFVFFNYALGVFK
jgi:hypothetical protein